MLNFIEHSFVQWLSYYSVPHSLSSLPQFNGALSHFLRNKIKFSNEWNDVQLQMKLNDAHYTTPLNPRLSKALVGRVTTANTTSTLNSLRRDSLHTAQTKHIHHSIQLYSWIGQQQWVQNISISITLTSKFMWSNVQDMIMRRVTHRSNPTICN